MTISDNLKQQFDKVRTNVDDEGNLMPEAIVVFFETLVAKLMEEGYKEPDLCNETDFVGLKLFWLNPRVYFEGGVARMHIDSGEYGGSNAQTFGLGYDSKYAFDHAYTLIKTELDKYPEYRTKQ